MLVVLMVLWAVLALLLMVLGRQKGGRTQLTCVFAAGCLVGMVGVHLGQILG